MSPATQFSVCLHALWFSSSQTLWLDCNNHILITSMACFLRGSLPWDWSLPEWWCDDIISLSTILGKGSVFQKVRHWSADLLYSNHWLISSFGWVSFSQNLTPVLGEGWIKDISLTWLNGKFPLYVQGFFNSLRENLLQSILKNNIIEIFFCNALSTERKKKSLTLMSFVLIIWVAPQVYIIPGGVCIVRIVHFQREPVICHSFTGVKVIRLH